VNIGMRVKINAIAKIIGTEELIIIPITRNGDFVLALNFYEDVEGGRLARFVLVYDKFGEIDYMETIIRGDKIIVTAEGIEEDFKKISNLIKIDKYLKSNRIPLFVNISVLKDANINERGVKGFINYVAKFGRIDVTKVRNVVQLTIEENV